MKYCKSIPTLLLFILFLPTCAISQDAVLDSLLQVLQTTKEDSSKVFLYHEISDHLKSTDFDKALDYANQGIALAEKIHSTKGLENCLNVAGVINAMQGNYDSAIEIFNKTLTINQEIADTGAIAGSFNNLGLVYFYKGDYAKAVEYYLESVRQYESTEDRRGIASTYNNIGLIYEGQEEFEKAISYHSKALAIRKILNESREIAFSLANIGNIHFLQGQDDQALGYFLRALQLFKKVNDIQSIALLNSHIGNIYKNSGHFDKANEYFTKGIEIQRKLGDKYGISTNLLSMGEALREQGKMVKATELYLEAYKIAGEIGAKETMKKSALQLSKTLASMGQYKKAYEYNLLYTQVKDSILNEEDNKRIAELQTQYESEQKEKEITLLKTEKELQNLALNRNKLIIYGISGGLCLILFFTILVLKNFHQKKKAFKLLKTKNEEVLLQKEIIEEKNKDITDSIKYGKKIQQAIVPSNEYLERVMPEHFKLFKPRNIVSGDFYWAFQSNDKVIWAVVDCTGHGVPGAFMSMIGNSLLNEIVVEKKIENSDAVLNEMRSKVIAVLGQKGESGEQSDGMDMAICILHKKSGLLEFSGANNPLWIINPRRKQWPAEMVPFSEAGGAAISPDKQPIGFYPGDQKPFTRHIVKVEKGDAIYIFSDGYPDQFGGPKGKKLKKSKLKEILLSVYEKPMQQQGQHLHEEFEQWRNGLEQVDDVCIIGVRV